MSETKRQNYLWQILVVVLIIILIAQSALTYQVLTRESKKIKASTTSEQMEKEIKLVPRKIATVPQPQQPQAAQNSVSQQRQMAMPPLPHLSKQVQSSPVMQQCTAPQQQTTAVRTSYSPRRGMMMSHQDPFGMDMRAEMARMEQIMDAMMQGMQSRSMFGSMMDEDPFFSRIRSLPQAGRPTLSVDKENNYIVKLQIPGLDKSDVKATVSGNILTVSGVKKEEKSNSGQGIQSYISSSSSFQNSFALPGPAKAQGLKMDYQGDTLTIKIPKA